MSRRVTVRRVYDECPPSTRGYRVLVDRLWPRGVAKADLTLDEWAKDVAPSTELRRWYGHDPARFDEFARRYLDELRRAPASECVGGLRRRAGRAPLVLLTATRDVERSGASVLRRVLRSEDATGEVG